MKAYKGFNQDMTCLGFQFEEGKTYEEPVADLCKSGFHACEDPLDCFGYYPPSSSVYHEVELDDVDPKRENEDSKVAARKIKIGAKIDLASIIKASVDLRLSRVGKFRNKTNSFDRGVATNSGDMGVATNSGYMGAATNSGDMGAATNGGYMGAATNSGYRGAATNSGAEGVAINLGIKGKVMGALHAWIVCDEWMQQKDGEWHRVALASAYVDGKDIKPDTWYKLENGGFVEVVE